MNKNYIIVGGSSGIGFEITKQLSEAGNNVTVLSRSTGEIGSLSNVTHIEYDVTSDLFPEIDLDSIDGFAYCPGTINLKPFHGLKPEDFQEDFSINVLGAVKTLQPIVKQLKKNGNASIVFFSTVAVQQGMPFHSSVAASKGALEGITRSLAAELAPKVRVNCIAPSVTDTPLASRILSSDEKKENSGKRHALNRVGTPEEVAKLATFLLTEESSWMTGQIIGLDGGMSAIRPL
ncbi:SDR family NAD(P)-dependent oxidoreductase [Ekhidna sp. To15]|uniref:SDR family NAD(P)-dependent oxidoreductase n=1 Tax=Ekhidna sp. To15 TaxID=3395267 RepID=UPI003F523951